MVTLNKIIENLRLNRFRRIQNDYEKKYLVLKEFPNLSDEQIAEINNIWPYGKLNKDDLTWHRIYKSFHDFSPYVLGLYQSCVFRAKVNPGNLQALENKGLCDIYFPTIPFPYTFVRRINKVMFDNNMNVISEKDIPYILSDIKEFIIKPSIDTQQGVGVRRINIGDNSLNNLLSETIAKYSGDFVIQEVIKQHPELSAFSPSCLNTCRITSIYIDGDYDYSIMLKIGKAGAFKDNWNSSYLVGADNEGVLNEWGVDYNLNKVMNADNGKIFAGKKIPYIEEMLNFVENCHKRYFPNCGIIGWDITVDVEGKIEVIETNLTEPGLVAEQLVSGPFLQKFLLKLYE